MRSRLCILKTVKLLKMILDSAMASKMKNIYHKKASLFLPGSWISSKKKLHGLSEEPNLLTVFVLKKFVKKETIKVNYFFSIFSQVENWLYSATLVPFRFKSITCYILLL